MAIKFRTNNRILPNNSRAVDVARTAIEAITPIEQQRSMNAFRVQGYPGILYTYLLSGRPCTCQSANHALKRRLNQDGTATEGFIDELLNGMGTVDVSPYVSTDPNTPNATSPLDYFYEFNGVSDLTFDMGRSNIQTDAPSWGANGPSQVPQSDSTVSGSNQTTYDPTVFGYNDSACPVCFGTSFIGGYAPQSATRLVLPVQDWDAPASELLYNRKPWGMTAGTATTEVILPLGAVGVDSMLLYDNDRMVPFQLSVDGDTINNSFQLMQRCDGKLHTLKITAITNWTHFELQFVTTKTSLFFEFPKLGKSADLSLLERTEPFQLILSPNIPTVNARDVIVESTQGKALVVQGTNPWNTKRGNILGWEVTVRPIQPQEILALLPKRGKVRTNQPAANPVVDNSTGRYRT